MNRALRVGLIGGCTLTTFAACSLATSLDGLQPQSQDAGSDQSSAPDAPISDVANDTTPGADVFVPPSHASALTAGGQLNSTVGAHACAIVGIDRSLFCWGANDYGQLGNGKTGMGSASADQPTPVKILIDASNQPFTGVDDVAAGSWNTCARKGQQMYCWGQREGGGVGDGQVSKTAVTAPLDITGNASGGNIGVGGAHACYIAGSGQTNCFGLNHSEQLGHSLATNGDVTCSPFFDMGNSSCNPNALPTAFSMKAAVVSAGTMHTCVLTFTGGVLCWGYNGEGATGTLGGLISTPSPVTVNRTGNVPLVLSKLRSTARHNCGIDKANAVWCWGQNDSGQVGQPPVFGIGTATQVANLIATDVAVGEHASCAITMTKDVVCWGDDSFGQLGDGAKLASSTPQPVKGPNGTGTFGNAAALALGYGFACALTTDASVWCWGRNDHGQLGDGTTKDRPFPVRVVLP